MKIKHRLTVAAVPATVREVVDHVTCDLCGKRGREPRGFEDGVDWHPGICDCCSDIVVVQRTEARTHGADRGETKTSYHVCVDCWERALVPLLAARGVRPTIEK